YAPKDKIQPSDTLKLLAEDQLYPVSAPGMSLEEIAQLPLLQVAGYTGDWHWWLARAATESCDKLLQAWITQCQHASKQTLRSDNSLTIHQLAAQGMGVAIARSSLVQPLLQSKQLEVIQNAPALPSPDFFYASLSPQGINHPSAQALFSML
ncbi:MAG: LysR substrate-binding domain-containing protein, partial [Granulosicoccaceae bacterium]